MIDFLRFRFKSDLLAAAQAHEKDLRPSSEGQGQDRVFGKPSLCCALGNFFLGTDELDSENCEGCHHIRDVSIGF